MRVFSYLHEVTSPAISQGHLSETYICAFPFDTPFLQVINAEPKSIEYGNSSRSKMQAGIIGSCLV